MSHRALVTGAAGFIGSHLCDALLAQGWEVIALDNGASGRWDNLAVEKPPQVERVYRSTRERLYVIQAEAEDEFTLETLPRPDLIVHLAGHVGVDYVLQSRAAMLREAGGLWAILDYATDCTARLIVTSTSEVYGSSGLCREQDVLQIGPSEVARSAYAAAKVYAEHCALAAHATDGTQVTVIRPFNVAGPRQRPDNVLARWLHAVASGQPIVVHGHGYVRAFTHVTDFVAGLLRLTQSSAAIGRVVNIGQGTDLMHLPALALLVQAEAARWGHRADIVVEEPAPATGWGAFKVRSPEVSLFHELTGMTLPGRTHEIVADMATWAFGAKR